MSQQRSGSHTIHNLQIHFIWCTKYRYQVLRGEVQLRVRDLIKQGCDALDVQILKGVVSKGHIHLYLSYPPKLSVSDLVRRLNGRSARSIFLYDMFLSKYIDSNFYIRNLLFNK
ncbi:MAG: IS200/IS605 family transposase [Pseudomonadota bacterium]